MVKLNGQSFIALLSIPKESTTVKNPFSGEKVELTPLATAVYDLIKGSEILKDRKSISLFNYALDFFSKK